MIAGTGRPATTPAPGRRKAGGNPVIGAPPVYMKDSPRASPIMPRVAMNGGSRSLAVNSPLTHPSAAPAARAQPHASGAGNPDFAAEAATSEESASTLPTDRSIPPVRMTTVMPSETTPMIDDCRSTFSRLATVKKRPSSDPASSISPASSRSSRALWSRRRRKDNPPSAPRRGPRSAGSRWRRG